MLLYSWTLLFFLLAIFLLSRTFFIVKQQSVAVIERFGKYQRVVTAGLHMKIPFVEWIVGQLSLRIYQLNVEIETKTQDNVFVRLQVSVQYRVKPSCVEDAFYKLENDREQITAYVFDVVRAEVPKMLLDDVFEQKESIANAVKTELMETMQNFGYEIIKALVTDIQPDEKVKNAMNEINEQRRLRIAALETAEAEKNFKIKRAEGDAESQRLQGEGIANQRKAIIHGLRDSVEGFQQAIPSATATDVMNLIMINQYCDTLKDIGAQNKSTTLLLPHSPTFLSEVSTQIQQSVLAANIAAQKVQEGG